MRVVMTYLSRGNAPAGRAHDPNGGAAGSARGRGSASQRRPTARRAMRSAGASTAFVWKAEALVHGVRRAGLARRNGERERAARAERASTVRSPPSNRAYWRGRESDPGRRTARRRAVALSERVERDSSWPPQCRCRCRGRR
jgi:hypothetical protein